MVPIGRDGFGEAKTRESGKHARERPKRDAITKQRPFRIKQRAARAR